MLTAVMPAGERANALRSDLDPDSVARARFLAIRRDLADIDIAGQPLPMASIIHAIATMTEPEAAWMESSKHPLARGMRYAWAAMMETPDSEARSQQFCRGLECLRKYGYHRDFDVDALLMRIRDARSVPVGALAENVRESRDSAEEARRVADGLEQLSTTQHRWIATDPDPYAAHVRRLLAAFCAENYPAHEAGLLVDAFEEMTTLGLGEVMANRAAAPRWTAPAVSHDDGDTEVVHAEYAYCLARWRNVLILHWRTAPTASAIADIAHRAQALYAAHGQDGVAMLVRIVAGTSMPDAAARQANAELLARYGGAMRAQAIVVEDTGAIASIKRAVVTALLSVSGRGARTRFFGNADAGAAWLSGLLGGDAEGLQEALRLADQALNGAVGRS